MQLSADLQEFIATNRLSAAKLQANHQFGAKSSNATRVVIAGNVPRYMWSLLRYILSELTIIRKGQPTIHLP